MSGVWVVGGPDELTTLLAARLEGAAAVARDDTGEAVAALRALDRDRASSTVPSCLVVSGSLVSDRWGAPVAARAERLLRACAECRPGGLVLVASSLAQEPNHHHPGMVGEGFPLSGRTGNPLSARWRELEGIARTALAGVCPLVVLRAAPTPFAGARDPLSRWLRSGLGGPLPGFDPPIQLLDADDLAEAVALVVERVVPGGPAERVLHVAPASVAPLRVALRLARRARLPVPLAARRALLALRVHPRARDRQDRALASGELDLLRFPATVSGAALEGLGFRPRFGTAETVLRRLRPGGASPPAAPLPSYDDWGMSPAFVAALGRTVFRFLRQVWFRLEVDGVELLPPRGPAVLVGTHRGFVPLDAMLALDVLARERGLHPRFLVHPGLLRWPWIARVITRLGGVLACRENADRVLAGGGVLGVLPEGVPGAFSLYRDAYRVRRFLSRDFVAWARRHQAPLLPFVTLGSAEAFPILGRIDWKWWRRRTEWPFLPVTPTSPLLPVPLPVKWHTRFLPPIVLDRGDRDGSGGRAGAEDREVADRLRDLLQHELSSLRARRRSIFYGDLFGGPAAPGSDGGDPAESAES